MACPTVTFEMTGHGPTTLAAIRDASDRSLALAFQLCSAVSQSCPEPGAQPLDFEFLSARVVEQQVEVRVRFKYQCHAPGAGCLLAPFGLLIGARRTPTPRPADADRGLDELLGLREPRGPRTG